MTRVTCATVHDANEHLEEVGERRQHRDERARDERNRWDLAQKPREAQHSQHHDVTDRPRVVEEVGHVDNDHDHDGRDGDEGVENVCDGGWRRDRVTACNGLLPSRRRCF